MKSVKKFINKILKKIAAFLNKAYDRDWYGHL
ncbi:hypothetical protein SAMN05421825_2867 [Epilithonimonas hungarica]|uniref:Uncharacterized protein n=1 Tax=Epilithonimonas hungarica TaxID=454006 RepID=A0A1G7S5S6_9FLAO|nr:hypothetical protein SAMN05421825_2867 [Epilithonimonas hungarica]